MPCGYLRDDFNDRYFVNRHCGNIQESKEKDWNMNIAGRSATKSGYISG
jgi:hypothetical protein